MKIALITEGTYPYVHGGVSVWCDRLIRKLSDVEFTLCAIAPAAGRRPIWKLPPNVSSFVSIDFEPTTRRSWDRYPARARRRFLEAFDAFLVATLSGPTRDEREFLTALRGLFETSRDLPIDVGIRAAPAFELLRARWGRRRVGDRLDQMGAPSLFDILEVTSSLGWFLKVLQVVPDGDVAHPTANGLSSLAALAAKWANGTPCLLTEHGIYLRERYLEARNSVLPDRVKAFHLLFFRRLNDATLQTVDLISPVSDYNRRWELEMGAAPDLIRTIHNGVEPARFPPVESEPAVPTISWVGRVDPLKDLVTLIEAFARVRRAIPDARLRLFGPVPAGNESYHAECLRTIDSHGLADAVTFEGLISRVSTAHEAGHVVALSSISEGFPFTVLEAMMSGRATVSTDVGGVAEAVGDAGLLVSPRDPEGMADALIRLLEDDDGRRRLGKAARERVLSRFTLDQMARRYRAAYETLAALPRPIAESPERPLSTVGGGR